MKASQRRLLCSCFVLLVTGTIAVFDLWPHPKWASDGFVYTTMMLRYAGHPSATAQQEAQEFFLETPVGKDARFRPYFLDLNRGMFSAESKPFGARVLYPYLASRLYPQLGVRALIAISVLAYVAAALLLYLLISLFVSDWLAVLIAMSFMATPLMRSLGASALTDMLAVALWSAALFVGVLYLRRPRAMYLFAFSVLCICLGLTRPLVYLPLGFGLGAMLVSKGAGTPWLKRPAFALTACAVLSGLSYAVASSYTATPGISSHLHWLYHLARTAWFYANPRVLSSAESHSFSLWYIHESIFVFVFAVGKLIVGIIPIFVLVLSMLGLREGKNDAAVAGLIGSGVLGTLAVLANPVLTEVPRLIEAPLYPIVASGLGLFANTLWLRRQRKFVPNGVAPVKTEMSA